MSRGIYLHGRTVDLVAVVAVVVTPEQFGGEVSVLGLGPGPV